MDDHESRMLKYLFIADACGNRFYRLTRLRGTQMSRTMDRDDWIQEARVALWQLLPKWNGEIEAYLARAVKLRVARAVFTPLRARKRLYGDAKLVHLSDKVSSRLGASSREIALVEAALDVRTLLEGATPLQHGVLTATLADAYIERGGLNGKHKREQVGRRMTAREISAKQQFITTARRKVSR